MVIDKDGPILDINDEEIITNDDLEISFPVKDDKSGVLGVWYRFAGPEEGNFIIPSLDDSYNYNLACIDENDMYTITKDRDNFTGYCYIWSYDKAGNASDTLICKKIVMDIDEPKVYINGVNFGSIYNSDITINFDADDTGDSSSGIEKINYVIEYYKDGKNSTKKVEGEFSQSDIKEITIIATASNADKVVAEAWAYDTAGNISKNESVIFAIDTNPPEISVKMFQSLGAFSDIPVISTETSQEAVRAPYKIIITATDDGKEVIYAFEVNEEVEITKIDVIANDRAGNVTNYSNNYNIIIDAIDPSLVFDYTYVNLCDKSVTINNGEAVIVTDNEETKTGKIGSKSGITIDIKVPEEDELYNNFKDKYMFDISLYKNGKECSKYQYGKQIAITNEGEYVIKASVTDEVGHKVSYKTCNFVIDKNIPIVTSEENYENWTNHSLIMSYSVTDNAAYYDTGVRSVWYTFDNSAEFSTPLLSETTKYKQAVKKSDNTFTIEKTAAENFDGYCHIWAYDNVGNVNSITHKALTDIEEPELKIKGVENEKIYNTDIAVIFQANDFIGDNTISSGFDRVDYKIEYSIDDKSVLSEGKLENNGGIIKIDAS